MNQAFGTQVFLASRNAKKLAELRRILSALVPEVEVLGLDDVSSYPEPVEDQLTFVDNALLKARAGLAATGLPSIADDSGLCVDALNGLPGVLSARWSGKPKSDDRNNALLLDQLADVPDGRRGAGFHCAVAFCRSTVEGSVIEETSEGIMSGRVIHELRGSGGFGYDALFVPEDQPGSLTSAELPAQVKDQISHRGQALREIAPRVAAAMS